MTTNRDIVKGALRLIHVIDATEDPAPEDADTALVCLRDVVASWEGEDIHHGFAIDALGDTFPFEDKHVKGIKNILAVEVASEFGRVPSAQVKANSITGYQQLKADYSPLDIMRPDPALSIMPSQRRTFDV